MITTLTLPNYLLHNPTLYECIFDHTFITSKSVLYKQGKLSVRIGMHMVILLLEGQKIVHLPKGDLLVDASEIIYTAQGNYFMTEIVGAQNRYQSILICFDDQFVLNFIQKYAISFDKKERSNPIAIVKKSPFLHSCVETINAFYTEKRDNTLSLIKLKTEELFLYSLWADQKGFLAFLKCIVETESSRIKYILESNTDVIQTPKDMGDLTRLNERLLRKEMARLYHMTPKKWLDHVRLQKAQLLLKNTDDSISQIATTCGYANISWFITQFKKHYNATPFLYRQENLHQ